jgi:hypothetical protein
VSELGEWLEVDYVVEDSEIAMEMGTGKFLLEVPLMAQEKKPHIQALELEMVHMKVEREEMTVMAWVTRMTLQKLETVSKEIVSWNCMGTLQWK